MNLFQTVFSNVWGIVIGVILLGVTIFVHELGHFLAAKKRGLKIERFSIGFGPKVRAWTGKDGVEYRIAWIPFGGYVSLPQLADMPAIEGETKSDVEKLPPLSFTDKIVVAVAGPFFNLAFALVLATLLWAVGQKVTVGGDGTVIGYVSTTVENSDGVMAPGPSAAAGLRIGDIVLAVDGKQVSSFDEINGRIIRGSGRDANDRPKTTLTVKRGENVLTVDVTPVYVSPEHLRDIGISSSAQIVAAEVLPDSAAAESGLKAGDILTRIDGIAIMSPDFIRERIAVTKEKPVVISYIRDGAPGTLTIIPRLDNSADAPAYRIGVSPWYASTTAHILPWTQIATILAETWRNFASIANPNSDIGMKNMSGPVQIINMLRISAQRSPLMVIMFMILINVGLAVFNLLPIPVLDGGHILFACITKVRGRPLPQRVIMTAQSVCLLLLISLMIYVTFFDIRKILPQPKPAAPAPAAQQAPVAPVAPVAPQQQPAPAK